MPAEFELIARYFTRPARTATLGVGDDCALVAAPAGCTLAFTTDMLVEGTHFLAGTDARKLGHKSLAVNLSDLAAMGADPRWFLLSIALPVADEAWLAGFSTGLFALADKFKIELVGGDTTRGPLNISITAIGTLPVGCALRRDGASVGDDIWISGSTGDAALGLAHLQGRVRLQEEHASFCVARLEMPQPRIALGCALREIASAAIDVSDGLLADLGHIFERSNLGAEIEFAALPRSAAMARCVDGGVDSELARGCLLAGGDDYELIFTAPTPKRNAVEAAAGNAGVAVTRIGRMVAGNALALLDAGGKPLSIGQETYRRGYDHFAGDPSVP